MGFITKKLFLAALTCPTKGWRQQRETAPKPLSPADQLRIEEGMEIHARARELFPDGVSVAGSNRECLRQTLGLLSAPDTTVIFEATFIHGDYIAKADILVRTGSHWKLVEVKSNVNADPELIDDIAYTVFVAQAAGLPIASCSLLLISKEYRLGTPSERLFRETDHTDDAIVRAAEFHGRSDDVAKVLSGTEEPQAELVWECKGCDFFGECVGHGIEHHIFDLPRLSHTKFCRLRDMDVVSIEGIPSDFKLTEMQRRVRQPVLSGEPMIDREGLKRALGSLRPPVYHLDFESVQTCLPLYPDIAPYTQIPTQYSLHICNGRREIIGHREYLAAPDRDCRRDLAENLIEDCQRKGSIVVYTSFEKTIIRGLGTLFPDLGNDLEGLLDRLFDLHAVIRQNLYCREFHGSYSIKKVLPAVAPFMGYGGMAVENGLDASAMFAFMARGRYRGRQAKKVRRDLLEYCAFDTLALVTVVDVLRTTLERMDEQGEGRVAV